ncbi:arginine/serine-rich protein 1-like [Hyperolius riggenbachi]|uniref:arginine/serine-rich protein 1-like n=1 Tax=Hyperolius riggenbachi TaxID=752182 RepID=UPI0035A31E4A
MGKKKSQRQSKSPCRSRQCDRSRSRRYSRSPTRYRSPSRYYYYEDSRPSYSRRDLRRSRSRSGRRDSPRELSQRDQSRTVQSVINNDDILAIIRQAVSEQLSTQRQAVQIPQVSAATTAPTEEVTIPSNAQDEKIEEEIVEEEISSNFDFALVEPLILAVKAAIECEEVVEKPQKVKKYYPHLKKKESHFPLMEEIKALITDEWDRPDKKVYAKSFIQALSNP